MKFYSDISFFLISVILITSRSSCSIIDTLLSLRKVNEDCDILHLCATNLDCRDYRCSDEGLEDNQVKWAPDGPKCDLFHKCQSDQKCKMHRCQTVNSIITNQ